MIKNVIFSFDNYRDFLKNQIETIKSQRKAFSIRAMARHLEIGATTLTEVLGGKKKLSLDLAYRISQKLKLSPQETDYFLLLTMNESAKEDSLKKHLQAKIRWEKKSQQQRSKWEPQHHAVLNWKNAVILSIASSFESFNNTQISKVLNISTAESSQLLTQLCELQLIESRPDKSFTTTQRNFILETKEKHKALTHYYSELLNKTLISIHKDSVQERVLGSEVLTFSSKHLPYVEKIINNCLDKLVEFSDSLPPTEIDSVYLAGSQFIRLAKVNS